MDREFLVQASAVERQIIKKTPGRTLAERIKYWTNHIEQARKYKGGIAAYCVAKKIGKESYYSWFRRLRVEHPEWKSLNEKGSGHRSGSKRNDDPEETEVKEKSRRRTFSASYRAKILAEFNAAPPGKRNSILRREGLYSSHISKWRELQASALKAQFESLDKNSQAKELASVQLQLARTEKQLKDARELIELQKKISDILGASLRENADSE